MSKSSRQRRYQDRHAIAQNRALEELEALRGPLFRELEKLLRATSTRRSEPAHLCCKRDKNQMRISPLEARAIAEAFRDVPHLRAKMPQVLERLRNELPRLDDDTERQNFDCPLLEGTRCLVHRVAKPIGCLAWHPGRDYSETAMQAFAACDRLNDRLYGRGWKLRVIPLWLRRVFKRRGKPRIRGRESSVRTSGGEPPARSYPRESSAGRASCGASPKKGGRARGRGRRSR